ncbi:ABC transporter substrate-binding protein [Phytopseudomonas dryadis]|uniref:Putative aliphatic sulfonates-binding protein n=1 Tax=Phytopseudomonas dryadis TaxID=2487520 RepID=A0A4Q9QUB0_9GAMM|nr:ABC transporter substrate-binding protein [Pseudomonas dryadis]TBU85649.1 aliphatic sulfonate ABC transporter substrate-binding protein [Pseudomonas dryadis]
MRRREFNLLLGLAAASPWLSSATGALAASSLRVGRYKGDLSYSFEAAGVSLPYPVSYYVGGAPITEALASQQLDLAGMSEIPPVFALPSNTTYKLVGVMKMPPATQVILVPEKSSLEQLADLRGKRIGYVRATTSHFFLLQVLKEQGLSWQDVQAINLTTQDGLSAFQSGELDAWFIYGVFVQFAKFRLGARLLKDSAGYLSGNYPYGVTNAAWADPVRRQAVRAYLDAMRETLAWVAANPRQWAELNGRLTHVPAAYYLDQLDEQGQLGRLQRPDHASIQSQQQVADALFAAGAIPQQVDVSPLWDLDFLA